MKKKCSVLSVIVFVAMLSGCTMEKVEVQNAHADFGVIYTDLAMLEDHSDDIVEVEYTGETEVTPFPESGDPSYAANLSKVKINKVYQGNLTEGETIWVSEPGVLLDNVYQTTEGYVHMNTEGRYMLFIHKFESKIGGKVVYSIVGAHQGKFDLTIDKEAVALENPSYRKIQNTEYFGGLVDPFNKVKKEVHEKYGETRSE